LTQYVSKPEPHGYCTDSVALRKRSGVDDNRMHYLNGREVHTPEAAFRVWGFQLHAQTSVTSLITKPPHKRLRCILSKRRCRASDISDNDSNGDGSDDDNDYNSDDNDIERAQNAQTDCTEAGFKSQN
jgi:hypothetical protein